MNALFSAFSGVTWGWLIILAIVWLMVKAVLHYLNLKIHFNVETQILKKFCDNFGSKLKIDEVGNISENLYQEVNDLQPEKDQEFLGELSRNHINKLSSEELNEILVSENISSESIIGKTISSIILLKNKGLKINIPVIREYIFFSEYTNKGLNNLRFLGSQSMLLGMLGTFIGLIIMISELSGSLANIKEGGILQGIKDVQNSLNGVQTAFLTTLFGLLASLLVSFLKKIIDQKFDDFFKQYDFFLFQRIVPYALNLNEQEGHAIISEMTRELNSSFKEINSSLQKNEKIISGLNHIHTKFDQIITNVKNITNDESSKIPTIIGSLTEVNHSVVQIVDDYEKRLNHLESIQKTNERNLLAYQNALGNYQNTINHDILMRKSIYYGFGVMVFIALLVLGIFIKTVF